MSNNQFFVFDPKRKRSQSIQAAMASISNMVSKIEKEEETNTKTESQSQTNYQDRLDYDDEEEEEIDLLSQFCLPPNTIMTRQDTFGELPQSSFTAAKRQSTERLSLPSMTRFSWKSDDASVSETFYSLDKNPSFDYETSASVREAKMVSIRKSPTLKRSPDCDTLRKSYSCVNLRSKVQDIITPTQELYDAFPPYKSIPILNLARHTRDSSFSISSPETVLTSYFSDTEDIETPESPFFNTHEDIFSSNPTLRQIRNSFWDQAAGPSNSRESSANGFKIKPLTLLSSPKTKSEAYKRLLRERVETSSTEHKGVHHTFDSTAMRYQHSEPINEAERLIQSYFADTNLMRQHLYNQYNAKFQHSQQPVVQETRQNTSSELIKFDSEVLLDISTGGWGGRYSTGEEVPPLLYHESSAEYFREQMQNMKAEEMVENEYFETIDSDQTPTEDNAISQLPNPEKLPQDQTTTTTAAAAESERIVQKPPALKVLKKRKPLPPMIPPKSPRRPQTMMKATSYSFDLERKPSMLEEILNHQEDLSEKQVYDTVVKERDFVNEIKPEMKPPTPFKPRMLRASRSENALDRYYHNSGNAYAKLEDPLMNDERASLTLSRLGFNSKKDFNSHRSKLHTLNKPTQINLNSDEDLGFSTNVTPSSQRSSRLIRSVAALKSLSKRITGRKSQLVDLAQKIQPNTAATARIHTPVQTDNSRTFVTQIPPKHHHHHHHPTNSDPSPQFTDAYMRRSRSLSPFQQRAKPTKKLPNLFV